MACFQIVGAVAFAAYRIWEATNTSPAVWQDSEAYLAQSTRGLVSSQMWTGPRAPGVPILLKLAGSYGPYGLMEGLVGVAAWGFLAWTASRLVRPGWRRVVMVWAVLGFATAPLVVQWDWSALSESPSLSTLAVLCALGLWMVQRFTWVRLAGLAAAAFAYEILRDADIWSVTIVAIVLIVGCAVVTLRGVALGPGLFLDKIAVKWRRTQGIAFVGVALLLVSVVTGVAAEASHRNVLNVEEAFYVRIFPFPARVAWFAGHGMPQAQAVDKMARDTSPAGPGQAEVVYLDITSPSWRPLQSWFATSGLTTYAIFLLSHPSYVLTAPFASPPLTYNNAQGVLSFYSPQGHAPIAALETVFAPNYLVVLVLAGLAIVFATDRRMWLRREWRFLAAFVVVGLLSMLFAWHGEGEEVTRHMVEGDVEARLGVLLALLVTLFGDPPAVVHPREEAASPVAPSLTVPPI